MANRYLEAFKENGNVVGLTTLTALSAALLNPLPLLIGLVAEAAYLVLVPDSKWYEARLSARHDEEVKKRRLALKQQMMPRLRPVMQARYMRLEVMHRDIFARQTERSEWTQHILRKLDFLLDKWLQFAVKETEFQNYLTSLLQEHALGDPLSHVKPHDPQIVQARAQAQQLNARGRGLAGALPPVPSAVAPPDAQHVSWVQEAVAQLQSFYERAASDIEKLGANKNDDETRAILQKRLHVLQRRREFVGKIGQTYFNLNHQLELLEDTFGLVADEMQARQPEQVLSDIEDVVSQTDTLSRVLEEMPSFDLPSTRGAAAPSTTQLTA